MSGEGPGRALRAAGSAARPVPAALRARFSARRWEGPAESRRPGQRAGPGIAAAAPGVPCGTAGQPEGKGTAGAALPVRQRPGHRAPQTSSPGNDQRQAAHGSPRSEPQRPGRSRGGRRGSAGPVPGQGRAGGAAGDHRSLFRPWPHEAAGGAGPVLPYAASRGPAPRPFPTIVVPVGSLGRPQQQWLCGRAVKSLFALQTALQTANAA